MLAPAEQKIECSRTAEWWTSQCNVCSTDNKAICAGATLPACGGGIYFKTFKFNIKTYKNF